MGPITSADHLPFPDLLWQLPQNIYQRTGKSLLIVGGSMDNLRPLLECAEGAYALSGRSFTIAVPQSLAEGVPALTGDMNVASLAETPTGSLAKASKGTIIELAGQAAVTILGYGLSKNPETQQLVASLVPTLPGTLILASDGVEGVTGQLLAARSNPTLVIADAGSFGRLLKQSHYTKHEPKTVIEHLYQQHSVIEEIAREWRTSLVLGSPVVTVVNHDGVRIVFPKLSPPAFVPLEPTAAGIIAGLLAQYPGQVFESAANILYLLQTMQQKNSALTRQVVLTSLPTAIREHEA